MPEFLSLRRPLKATLAAAGLALLAACGGGGSGESGAVCTTAGRNAWLQNYFDDWYFWYRISPKPSPSGYATIDSYFEALLYQGTDAAFPADRWSGFGSTESFNQFYGDGATLGYGVFVAGLEVTGQPTKPLYIRYIEPQSPAALAGLVRGDEIISLNGRSVVDIIAADDFSALSPSAAGQNLTVELRNGVGTRTVHLNATVYTLTPVPAATTRILTSPLGKKVGYVLVKDMISQAINPLDAAFASFRANGVQELVLDLRYNGGGLVSTGATVASYAAGSRAAGQVYAQLLYNDKKAANNSTNRFSNPANALGLSKVYVLTGERTCSASEQVVNGLRPFVNVVTIGDTTCGKPVGFLAEDDNCGNTYSIVNFESTNALNAGRYFSGFNATCAVAENFAQVLGASTEPLLAAAMGHADTGACPATASREQPLARKPGQPGRPTEPGERQGMLGR